MVLKYSPHVPMVLIGQLSVVSAELFTIDRLYLVPCYIVAGLNEACCVYLCMATGAAVVALLRFTL